MIHPHPFDLPTVGLFIEVPLSVESPPGSWRWESLTESVPAREYVYSERDLFRSLLSYGALSATMLARSGYPEFRLVARGLFTMRFLAQYTWHWSGLEGRYAPMAEPWIIWPPLNELPIEVRRGAIRTSQREDGRWVRDT